MISYVYIYIPLYSIIFHYIFIYELPNEDGEADKMPKKAKQDHVRLPDGLMAPQLWVVWNGAVLCRTDRASAYKWMLLDSCGFHFS